MLARLDGHRDRAAADIVKMAEAFDPTTACRLDCAISPGREQLAADAWRAHSTFIRRINTRVATAVARFKGYKRNPFCFDSKQQHRRLSLRVELADWAQAAAMAVSVLFGIQAMR